MRQDKSPAEDRNVLAIMAHPDDMEFMCAGTLALLAARDYRIHAATLSAGNIGSTTLPARQIARIRQGEARRSVGLLGGQYTWLGEKDLLIIYQAAAIRRVLELVRRVDPLLVFTHSPTDYMLDHEISSQLVRTACFGALAPNFKTGTRRPARSTSRVPYLYYAEPFGGRDILGQPVPSSIYVDISNVMERKTEMLACHESQRAWLKAHQEIDNYLETMRRRPRELGRAAGVEFAEGFRQHLGQGFPQENKLREILGDLVKPNVKLQPQ